MEDKSRSGGNRGVPNPNRAKNNNPSSAKARKSDYIKFLVAGIIIIALGNFFLKYLEISNLHRNGLYLSDYFTSVNSKTYLDSLLNAPWKLFLPVEISPDFMRWTTTGLIPVAALDHILGVDATFYLVNILLVVVSLMTSWFVLRSKVFSVTLAMCMGFGTQFIHSYVNSSIVLLYLFVIYTEINLLTLYFIFRKQNHRILFKTIFALSLIALALCWEMWVDYLAFLFLLSIFLFIVFRKKDKTVLRGVRFVLITSLFIALVYFGVKYAYHSGVSEHFARGLEGETVITYVLNTHSPAYIITAIEDMISNIITYNYFALTNYFPPPFTSSFSLFYLGKDAIISNQYGYATSFGSDDFVYNHHVFLWYFGAGIIFAVFCYFLLRHIIQSLKKPTSHSLILSSLLLLIATGAFTHLFIKYRFYLSLPLFPYKCIVSIVGVSLLIAYLLMYLKDRISSRRRYFSIVVASWLVIVVAAFTRPALLSDMLNLLKMGTYPDPWQELTIKFHNLF